MEVVSELFGHSNMHVTHTRYGEVFGFINELFLIIGSF